ncbi:sodium:solute symporter family protein [Sedimentisphaera salicampi]|uniref:Proline permease n=1 Tax=Sedimentisphaera salicampi TaxID=1941349 RepID=A0A1W6LIV4_9BACT|nr:sodium:solute symporter family protein [Sedimentisphaera salicampi]ARN55711.1 Proline permease [Sedimentisphaera salicampi]
MLMVTDVVEIAVIMAYLVIVIMLGWLGYTKTKTASDFMLAGRGTHPFVMAMSYGATFISTSAIVGFAGVAGMFGMGVLWLVFLNIFVGIFIAFVFLGERTRHMGHVLNAHTFAELLGRRYNSKAAQVFSGIIISLFLPLYAAAVFIGACEFITAHFGISYHLALLIFAVIVASYVVTGGLKGVMYVDAMQGTIMTVCMITMLILCYKMVGGVAEGHAQLTEMSDQVFVGFKAIGHQGWTEMPKFGWGDSQYDLWWILVSSIICGVGFGVLAQPQLTVRFMTVRSKRELNRGVLIGGLFILLIPGTAYVVANMSNVYFNKYETITGQLLSRTERADVIAKKTRDVEKTIPCSLLHIDEDGDKKADFHVIEKGLGKASAIMPKAEVTEMENGMIQVKPRGTAFKRALTQTRNGRWMLNADSVIPNYIRSAMPTWFSLLFLITLLSAGMSTLSSQFHTLGSTFAHDVFRKLRNKETSSVKVTRTSILVGIIIAMMLSLYARGGFIVARATAIFFGLCLSSFLPSLVGGLFFRRMTKPAALSSMAAGFGVTVFWLLFVKAKEAGAIGLVQHITGGESSILAGYPNWPNVDPCFVALPISVITAVVVAAFTKAHTSEELEKCFAG